VTRPPIREQAKRVPPRAAYTGLAVLLPALAAAAWWTAGGWQHGLPNGPLGVIDRWVLIVGWARIADALAARALRAAVRTYARRLVRKLRLLRDAARHDPDTDAAITKAIGDINTTLKQL
jgi:hypothetical protein